MTFWTNIAQYRNLKNFVSFPTEEINHKRQHGIEILNLMQCFFVQYFLP